MVSPLSVQALRFAETFRKSYPEEAVNACRGRLAQVVDSRGSRARKSLKIVVGEATAPLLPAAPVARSWACRQNHVQYVNHLPPINTFNGSGGTVARKECRRNSSQSATGENDHEHARHQKGTRKYPIAVSKRKCNRILWSTGHIVIGRCCGIRLSAQAHTTTRKHGRPPHKQHPPHSQLNNHRHTGNRVTMMTRTTNTDRQWWSCLGWRRRCYIGEKVTRR